MSKWAVVGVLVVIAGAAFGGACERAQIIGDAVVVATTGASPRALAIDLATGAVRWHVDAVPASR
jgi:PQQ enzyme repeat